MSLRSRLASLMAPRAAPLRRGGYVYAVGPHGMEAIKGDANPLLDAFMGTGDADGDLSNTPQGWAKAYKRSAWAFRCVLVRAQTTGSIPLRLKGPDGDTLPDHPLARLFDRASSRLLFETECDRQVFGPAYWEIGRERVQRLSPQTIERIADRTGIQGYVQRIDGQVVAEWSARQIVHFRDYDPDDDFGAVSAMSLALGGVDVIGSIGVFAAYFFKQGAMPAGVLVSDTPMLETDKQRILAEWKRRFEGVDRSHGTALLDGGRITYQPITPPLKDLAMAELREEERREIAAAFGVPMTIALMSEAANYATAKQDFVNFLLLTVKPELGLLTDTMNTSLVPAYGIPGVTVEAAWDEVEALQEDRGEITTRAATGFPAGVMSLNDALRLQQLEPITDPQTGEERDYFLMSGKLITREALAAGDLSTFDAPAPSAPSFPFMSAPLMAQLPARSMPQIIDQPPSKAVVDVVIHASDQARGDALRDTVLRDTMLKDLDRWAKKVSKKGARTPFEPDYLPDAITAFVRADLLAWDGETPREMWITRAFDRAEALVKADGDDFATPEEFEAYWRGIDGLFDTIAVAVETVWQDLPTRLANALRNQGQAGADDALVASLSQDQELLIAALVGADDGAPGPLAAVFLAGMARGNDLLARRKSQKAAPLTLDWAIADQLAKAWAQSYAAQLVRGITGTTLSIFREKIAAWVDGGGSLEDLAKSLEGELDGLTIPDGWSPGKLEWAVSRERARLIAQTETTRAFHEGAVTRWEQADVPRKKFRTANDGLVCDDCRSLNNQVTALRGLWTLKSGRQVDIPVHVGCRCFAAPDGV